MKADASASRTLQMPPLDLRAAVKTINDEARTAELIFSTGAAVERYDWMSGKRYLEKLSLDPAHIRLDRLNSGAPLLNAHGSYSLADVIGVVEEGSATVAGKTAKATVRFSTRADVEPIFQDVRAGILRNVSVGYRVHAFEEKPGKGDGAIPTRLATDWEPFEVSLVPMGADAGARVRGDKPDDCNPCVITTRAEEELTMNEETAAQNPTEETAAQETAPPDAMAEAVRAEQRRVLDIQTACRIAKMPEAFAADLVARNVTLADARAAIFVKMAERSNEHPTNPHIEVGEDTRDKWLRGAVAWLLVKGGVAGLVARATKADVATIDPGEFRGLTLIDLAKETLTRAGRSVRGFDKMRLVSEAFTLRTIAQSTSDFAVLLENTMHKVLQAAYATQPDTWRRFCATSTVTDFRAHNRYRMGSFGALDTLTEDGEFKHKAISDAEKATITAGTKGNIISVSRQMIVNDDMGAFSRLLSMLGRAAGLSVEVDVYALLALNSGLGPTQTDNQPLFYDTTRSNVSTQAALSAAALDLDRQKMAGQLDPWGHEYLDLRPAVLIVNVANGGSARMINEAQYDPDTVNKLQKPNVAKGIFKDIIDTPRVAGNRRYVFADANVAPVVEVAFLEGQEAPVLETKDGWNTDGAEMKVRFDYGVAAVDYRGAVTNAG